MVNLEPTDAANRIKVWAFAVLLGLSACATPPGSVAVKKSAKSVGPQVQAPVYKDGDWWRMKVAVKYPPGTTVSGNCWSDYSEYLVRIDNGRPEVLGIEADQTKEIRCRRIVREVLGKSKSRKDLKFPMYVGLTWSDRFFRRFGRGTWVDPQYEVQSWEKIKTTEGEFDAFKIVMIYYARFKRTRTYFYSPKVKANVYSHEKGDVFERTFMLVDVNLKN